MFWQHYNQTAQSKQQYVHPKDVCSGDSGSVKCEVRVYFCFCVSFFVCVLCEHFWLALFPCFRKSLCSRYFAYNNWTVDGSKFKRVFFFIFDLNCDALGFVYNLHLHDNHVWCSWAKIWIDRSKTDFPSSIFLLLVLTA